VTERAARALALAQAEHEDLDIEAELATQWKAERRELVLMAFHESYGPKPPLEDPYWRSWIESVEGRAYDLWLCLRPNYESEFPTHHDVIPVMLQDMTAAIEAQQAIAKLNAPDPEKNPSPLPPATG